MGLLLNLVFSRLVTKGDLEVVNAVGEVNRFGDGSGETVRVRFADAATERAVLLNPQLKLGEAFMDGRFAVEKGSVYDFLALVLSTPRAEDATWWFVTKNRVRQATRRLRQMNHALAARRNVAHHYDLGDDLYRLFLDEDWQYSCAYFGEGVSDLELAQLAKKRHIAAKLALAPGHKVLDIGSGWGGLGLYLAEVGDADVTGVTLSEQQHARSNQRAAEAGLGERARFLLKDYRHLEERFDRIVSVGMFEHVGVGHYDEFFRQSARLLADDGVMLLHSIGRFGPPGDTNAFIQKYIFPGGYIPALSEVLPAIERAGLLVTDMEILRLHYAETLRAWRERFLANRETALALFDERFCRMWEFYLAGSELAFRSGDMMVFQIQLARNQTVLPLTREYLARNERRLQEREEDALPTGRRPLRAASG